MFPRFTKGGRRNVDSPSVLAQSTKARHWLENLPLLNPAEAVARMHKALSVMGGTRLAAEQRLEILEIVHRTVETVSGQLIERRSGATLPLSKANQEATDLLASLHQAMVTGYSQVTEGFETQKLKKLNEGALALALQRTLLYLNEQCLESYRIYQPIETGMWQRIHQVVGCAFMHKLARTPQVGSDSGEIDILDLYKRMLLVALANPYQLAPGLVDKAYLRTAEWTALVGLKKQTDEVTARCRFVVDLAADAPASFIGRDETEVAGGECLVLDTSKLVIALYQHIRALERHAKCPEPVDQTAIERDESQFLQQLIVHWGGKARRATSRTTPADNREVVVGLDSINFFLNGERVFEPSGVQRIKPVTGTFGYQQLQADRYSLDVDWICVDESRAGMQLTKQDAETTRIRVGELVAVRRAGTVNAWDVGVIRWVRNQRPNTISFGMYKLAPVACAAAVQEDTPNCGYRQSLILPRVTTQAGSYSMVTPRGLFNTGKELLLHTGDEVQRVSLSRLVMATFSFEWFEYEPVCETGMYASRSDEALLGSVGA